MNLRFEIGVILYGNQSPIHTLKILIMFEIGVILYGNQSYLSKGNKEH